MFDRNIGGEYEIRTNQGIEECTENEYCQSPKEQ